MALQLRRGLLGELNTITPDNGEPIWTTDAKRMYVGDGSTVGGILVSAGQDVSTTSNVTFASVVVSNTATVGAIQFPDGSVQTTADTANPDQSLNTTSNVRFNSAVIATTATVTVLKFADGSTMTTADTANPDQALNTTSNVVFTSVTVGSGAGPGNVYPWTGQNLILGPATGGRVGITSTGVNIGTDANTSALVVDGSTVDTNADLNVKGSVRTTSTLSIKELNTDKKILELSTSSVIAYIDNAQAFKVDGSNSQYTVTLGSASAPTNINVANDAALSLGSAVNTYNINIESGLIKINRPSNLGGEPRLLSFGSNDITAWQNILPHQTGAISIGTTGTLFSRLVANKVTQYANTSASATTLQGITELANGVEVYSGRGQQATSNLVQNGSLMLRNRALSWNGFSHLNAMSRTYTAAGNWNNTLTSTVTNFGVNFTESICIPNMYVPTFSQTTLPTINWQAGTWNQATTRWPPRLELIEGFNASAANFALYASGNGAQTTTGVEMIRYLINQEVRLLAPPSQDTTATAAVGFNKLTFIATRESGGIGSRRSVASGDYLGEIHFNGVVAGDTTGNNGLSGARIIGQANTNYANTNTHASLLFFTTPDGSTVPDQRLSLNAGVSTFGTDILIFKNATNTTEHFRITGGNNRSSVQMICDTTLLVGGLTGAKYEVFTATNITSTATQQVGYFDTTGGLQHSAKFLVQVLDSGNIHFAEISVISDGTNTWKVEYGTNTSAGALGTFSAAMNGALATLYFAPTAPTSMDIKTVLTVL